MWGYDYFGGTRTVDVHVRRLRAKLGPEHETLIGTVRNVGYRFVLPAKESGRSRERDWTPERGGIRRTGCAADSTLAASPQARADTASADVSRGSLCTWIRQSSIDCGRPRTAW